MSASLSSQCSNGPSNGLGIFSVASDWSTTSVSVNAYNATDGSCLLQWKCDNACQLLAPDSTKLSLRSSRSSFASYVSYSLELPGFTASATAGAAPSDPSFGIRGAFYAPNGNALNLTALRGATSVVSIRLTPYVVKSSAGVTTSVAFEPSLAGSQFGRTIDAVSFNFSDESGFQIDFVLSRNSLSLLLYVILCIVLFPCLAFFSLYSPFLCIIIFAAPNRMRLSSTFSSCWHRSSALLSPSTLPRCAPLRIFFKCSRRLELLCRRAFFLTKLSQILETRMRQAISPPHWKCSNILPLSIGSSTKPMPHAINPSPISGAE